MERRSRCLSFLTKVLLALTAAALTAPVYAQDELSLDLFNQGGLAGLDGPDESLDVRTTLTAEKLAVGETAVLAVQVKLPEGLYIYSQNPSFGGCAILQVNSAKGLEPIDEGFRPDRAPKVVQDANLQQTVEKFYADVTWFRRYRITSPEALNSATLSGTLEGQYCNEDPVSGKCIPIRPALEFSAALESGSAPEVIASLLTSAAPQPLQTTSRPKQFNGDPAPVEFEFQLAPGPSAETVTLSIAATIDEGWHIFALTQDPEMAGLPTEITLEPHGLEAVDPKPVPDHQPEIEKPLDDIIQEVHYDKVTWTQTFRIQPGVEPDGFGIKGRISFQTCDSRRCLPPVTQEFALGQLAMASLPDAPLAATRSGEPGTGAAGADGAPDGSSSEAATAANAAATGQQGLLPFLMVAFLAGFAALLTPCVFPMVPITVSLFLKQSEREHHRPIWMASVYCGGIIVSFTVLGLLMAAIFGATSINELANNPWLNLMIAGVLIFFGMNLLGLFEIRVPSFLLTWSAGKEGQGGILGVLFMALTFTLVSFTCTFAFAGGLLVLAARGEFYWPVLGMLAFSTAFALPFFFLALFPSMLQKLPKSGGWMNTVKVTMGMIEMGAALKFLSVADLAWNPTPVVFDYSFTMSAWMIVALCVGLYLLGMFRLSHDSPMENISVLRFSVAMFFLTFGAYLGVGLLGKEEPQGVVWEQIRAFGPPTLEGGVEQDLGPFIEHDGLKFALDYNLATDYAAAQELPLFLDFTGVNCVNCRLMEKRMTKPATHQLLEKFVRVQLYTDNVPGIADRTEVDRLLDMNRKLQEQWFQDVTLPAYAVVTPDGKQVLATFKGLETEDGQFAEFLSSGLDRWKSGGPEVAAGPGGRR